MRRFYITFPGKQIYETLSRKSQKRQTVSDESLKGKQFQAASGKSETVSRKFTIPQTVSAKFQKSQTVSGKFEPMLSWSHYCELLKIEEPLAHSFYEHPFRSHIYRVVVEGAASSLVC